MHYIWNIRAAFSDILCCD